MPFLFRAARQPGTEPHAADRAAPSLPVLIPSPAITVRARRAMSAEN